MLFVATRHNFERKGLPVFLACTYTEEFNERNPTEPITTSDWPNYKPIVHGSVVPESMRLPAELNVVCKGLRSFVADIFIDAPHIWIVSKRFLDFWIDQKLIEGQYEQAKLRILTTKGKPVTEESYFLLRITHTNDDLVNFTNSPSIPSATKPLSKKDPLLQFYTDLKLSPDTDSLPVMIFHQRSLRWVFLCQEPIKQAMEAAGFLGLEFYTLPAFAQESRIREAAYSVEEYEHYKKQVAAGNHSGPFSKLGLTGPNRLS